MLNLASVRELNGRITDKIPDLSVKRFRANIIGMFPFFVCFFFFFLPPVSFSDIGDH